MSQNTQKNKPVSDQDLLSVWVAGAKAGKSKQDIWNDLSDKVGFTVHPDSMTQRITALRSRIRRGTTVVEVDGETMSFEDYCKNHDLKIDENDPAEVDGIKVVTAGREIPKLKTGGGRTPKSTAQLGSYLDSLLNGETENDTEDESESE